MKYQVLFLVNHGTIACVLSVESETSEPHPEIVQAADLLVEVDLQEDLLGRYGDLQYKVLKTASISSTAIAPVPKS